MQDLEMIEKSKIRFFGGGGQNGLAKPPIFITYFSTTKFPLNSPGVIAQLGMGVRPWGASIPHNSCKPANSVRGQKYLPFGKIWDSARDIYTLVENLYFELVMKYLIWKGIQARLPDGGIKAKSRLFEDIKGLKCQVRCLDTPAVRKRDKKDIYPLSPPIAGQECHKCPAKNIMIQMTTATGHLWRRK